MCGAEQHTRSSALDHEVEEGGGSGEEFLSRTATLQATCLEHSNTGCGKDTSLSPRLAAVTPKVAEMPLEDWDRCE